MDVTVPGLPEVIAFGGASVLVGIIFEAVKAAWRPKPDDLTRFGPLLSLVIGVACIVPFAAYQGDDLVAAALVGLLAGASASGLYGVAKSAVASRNA